MVKPRLGPHQPKAAEAADDARRYAMLYYWSMCFQLLGMPLKQDVVMHHVKGRPEEEQLLFKRKNNQALTVLVWLSSRIADLAVEGVLTQHELQEGLRRVDEMVEAFNGTTKIKNTPIPAPMEHLCAVLTNLYVITAPLAISTAFKNYEGHPVKCGDYDPDTGNPSYDIDAEGLYCTDACENLMFMGTLMQRDECPRVGFITVATRTMLATIFLGIAFYAMFELGNAFAEPFGDDESDLGSTMMTMGNGLEADLQFLMETAIPHSRLRQDTQKNLLHQEERAGSERESDGAPGTAAVDTASMEC